MAGRPALHGILLTAVEIGQLEVVPEVAFLNCCHLGMVDNQPTLPTNVNRLAYSVARELIEAGVRCVIVAGWAVNDQAAKTFAETFFRGLVSEGKPFGKAVHDARHATYDDHPGINTWGAYQAYGDPAFVLEPDKRDSQERSGSPVAPEELLLKLSRLRSNAKYRELKGFEEARQGVKALLSAAPPAWSRLADVQAAIGGLYGEFGLDGFEAARAAYERAITAEDERGRLPVQVIEQLSNLEARTAEAMCVARKSATRREVGKCIRNEAEPLVESAISRLEHLIAATAGSESQPPIDAGHPRRLILGSVYKTKAKLQADRGIRWSTIAATLQKARDAYGAAEGSSDDADFDPYAMINRLHLDAILDRKDANAHIPGLARKCQEAARHRFKASYDFWEAVKVADAELAIELAVETAGNTESQQRLIAAYRDAAAKVGKSIRQYDSVIKQIALLASFLRTRHEDDGKDTKAEATARALDLIIASLEEAEGTSQRG